MQLPVDDFHSSPAIPDCHANAVIYDNRNNRCDDHHNRVSGCVNQFIGLKLRISDPRTRARSQQRMSAAVGNHCASRLGEYGAGVNGGAKRRIGASSDQTALSLTLAAISAPTPPDSTASSAITKRVVLRTESTSLPSPSIRSAVASLRTTCSSECRVPLPGGHRHRAVLPNIVGGKTLTRP